MIKPKLSILCLIPSSKEYLLDGCIPAVKAQTIPVETILNAPLLNGDTIDERVVNTLNTMLSQIKLDDYDYILRVDGDCIIPKNFVEAALSTNSDLYGGCGCAMLLKVATFQKYMKGRFQYLDDAYLRGKYAMLNLKTSKDLVPYYHKSKTKPSLKQLTRKFLYRGKMLYILGWEPIHLIHHVIRNFKQEHSLIFTVPGYIMASFKHTPKLDIANWVHNYQIKHLIK